jgi:CRP-like cAMP-binding protein
MPERTGLRPGFRELLRKRRGDVLFKQGTTIPSHYPVYELVEGVVVREVIGEKSRGTGETVVDSISIGEVLKPGDFFGAGSEDYGLESYSATARVIQPVKLRIAAIDEVGEEDIMAVAGNRLVRARRLARTEKILKEGNTPERVAISLLDFAVGLTVSATQEDLSRRAGRIILMVKKELKRLDEKDLIARERGSISILDAGELLKRAGLPLYSDEALRI